MTNAQWTREHQDTCFVLHVERYIKIGCDQYLIAYKQRKNDRSPGKTSRKKRSATSPRLASEMAQAGRRRHFRFCVVLLALLITVAHARFYRLHRADVRLIPSPDRRLPGTVHGVDDVVPAVSDATSEALAQAEYILAQYSNTLRIVSMPVGLLASFFGHFLLVPVLFFAGFMSGGGLSFIATKALFGAETPTAAWITIVAMLIGGALSALIASRLISAGMFALGALLGAILAAVLSPSVLGRIYPPNADVGFYAGTLVLGIVLGLVAMQFQRQMIIVTTAYGGAFAFFFGIGFFAGHFPTAKEIQAAEHGNFGTWFVMYSLMTLLVGSLGALTQFRLAKGRALNVRGLRQSSERSSRNGSLWNDRADERANLPRNEEGKEHFRDDASSSSSPSSSKDVVVNVVNNLGSDDSGEGRTHSPVDVKRGVKSNSGGSVSMSETGGTTKHIWD